MLHDDKNVQTTAARRKNAKSASRHATAQTAPEKKIVAAGVLLTHFKTSDI
jgi:hypothetical protein